MAATFGLKNWSKRKVRVPIRWGQCASLFLAGFAIIRGASAEEEKSIAMRARQFIAKHESKLRPLEKEAQLAWWAANISGKDEDFKRKEDAQNHIDEALSDPNAFGELKAIRETGRLEDPLLARQIAVLHLAYLEKQVDRALLKKMVAKANAVEKAFNVFRAEVDGRELTENDVRRVLKESKSSDERRKVWEASKRVGAVVEKDLKELVRLRNQAAAQLGFRNYHQLLLHLGEQEQAQIIRLFDELDKLTGEPFRAAKAEIDEHLAADCGIGVADLRPWHYHDPFFQESPAVFGVDLDAGYKAADILQLCRDFYAGIGLPIHDVLTRSDLYEKPGKSPHAFCTDIDREGDTRVLANIVPNERWMETMLHELGHAVYTSINIPRSVPYVLRCESHTLTTEGVAMLFGRLSKNGAWQVAMGVAPTDPAERDKLGQASAKVLRNQLLIFSRWCQVMLRFEMALYENPDQDLNRLWWDLVEMYQRVRRPEDRNAPDYASKIHIVAAPVYYHNYMMGEMFASQVHHALAQELFPGMPPSKVSYVGNKDVGEFFLQRVFRPGKTLSWNELTKHITGEELSAKALAEDFHIGP
jgi:peptidyl-dipeptidase A